jgi:hypothetical protein
MSRFTHQECSALTSNLIQAIKLSAVAKNHATDLNDRTSLHPYTLGYLESFLSHLIQDSPELVAAVQKRIEMLSK